MKYLLHTPHGGFISRHWDKHNPNIPYTADPHGALVFTTYHEARTMKEKLHATLIPRIDVLQLLTD